MTDENATTSDLSDREILQQILRRLSALEAAEADRKLETKPQLNFLVKEVSDQREENKQILQRLSNIENDMIYVKKELRTVNTHIRMFFDDMGALRMRQGNIEQLADNIADRVENLEQKRTPN
jgi:chromosome segregation ATPase